MSLQLQQNIETCMYGDEHANVRLFQEDCLTFMDFLLSSCPEVRFDMIFADPPYFLSNDGITCHAGKMVSVNKGKWDKSEGAVQNHEFTLAWLSRCQSLLKQKGTLWVSGTHHIIHSVGFAMQLLGFKILNDIVWRKPNPPPNLSCRYFTHSTETVIWAAKDEKSRHYFNYDLMKSINGGKQMKSVWDFTAPGKPEKTLGKHPTQKPIALLERILLASTQENDLVFDPFTGSGTTGVAAVKLGRRFVGCEIDESFAHLASMRLHQASKTLQTSLEGFNL
ncbi:MAG: DNA methyltransferase [Anaerolineaceae bacterium]|nr:DNA methyltransferase [Anaerolineaceae bacterium]